MARFIIVEDRLSFADAIVERLRGARVAINRSDVAFLSHRKFLEEPPSEAALRNATAVLVDAFDYDSQQEDETASRFGGLHVCEHVHRLGAAPPVVIYSTFMKAPETNIAPREYPFVRGCIDANDLLEAVPALFAGERVTALVPPPTPADYRNLGVGEGARVAEAYHLMRRRPDAWELVWRDHVTPKPKTREWINDAVRPTLDIQAPTYRAVVQVMRRLSGLPVANRAKSS